MTEKSDWFDYWASDPKMVAEARRKANYAVAVQRLRGVVDDLFSPVLVWLDRILKGNNHDRR